MSINVDIRVFTTMIDNFDKPVSRTAVTKTESNISGDETLTDGTITADIDAAFFRKQDDWIMDKPGLIQNADAIILVKTSQALNKNDKIGFDGENFRVDKVIPRYVGPTKVYITGLLFKIS